MPSLSSLLVQREAATMRAVEEAISRQVLHGGDLATNLLEVEAVAEEVLLAFVSECNALLPVASGPLPTPPTEALRLVPGELALRHAVFPLAFDVETRTLTLATAEPLPPAVEDDLAFALDVSVQQRAGLVVRIRQAIAAAYAIPLDRRLMRLVARLEGRKDPSPSAFPPPIGQGAGGLRGPGDRPMNMPRPISVPAPTFGTGLAPSVMAPPGVSRTPLAPGGAADVVIPRHAPVPLALDPLTPTPSPRVVEDHATGTTHDSPPSTQLSELAPPPTHGVRAKAVAGVLRTELRRASAEISKTGRDVKAPKTRRKGPFTAQMAEAELDAAERVDDVLDAFFSFISQFVAYTAMFVLHADLAEGRAANGPGASAAKVATIGVPLDLPSVFASARERRGPHVARLEAGGMDAEIARDLERTSRKVAIVLPIVVKTRAVALVYGDDGDEDVSLAALGEVIAMSALAGAAIERVLLRKKHGGRADLTPIPRPVRRTTSRAASLAATGMTPPPARDIGVEALARALTRRESEAPPPTRAERSGTHPQPEPQVSPGAESVRTPEPPPPRATAVSGQDVELDMSMPGLVSSADQPRPAQPISAMAESPRGESISKAVQRYSAEGREANPRASEDPRSEAAPPSPRPVAGTPASIAARVEPGTSIPATKGPITTVREGPAPRLTQPGLGVPTQTSPVPPPPARSDPPGWAGPRSESIVDGRAVDVGSFSPSWDSAARSAPIDRDRTTAVARRTPGGNPMAPTDPPPIALTRRRPMNEKPLRREEDVEESPGQTAFASALDASPSPAQRFDIPARSRPPSMPPPASVIVDLTAEYTALLQRTLDAGSRGQEAFAELVKNGEQAVQVLMQRFPGPLRVDRHRARAELPAASQCGPLLELIVAVRRPALAAVTVRTSSPEVETRFWATHILGELRFAEAANALVPRLFDDDLAVRRVARRSAAALVSAGEPGGPILQGLDHMVRSRDQPVPYRVLAIETMAEIRAGAMVPPLVAVLSGVPDEVAEAARRALLVITRQDFGRDGKRWADWWAKHGERHRVEWLIDALMHEQPAIRRAAGDELKQITKEYFGYYDDLPKKERERAHALYRQWWDKEGRRRFA